MHFKIQCGKMIKKLFILFCVFASVGSESCKTFQIKKEHLNKRLIGHEISKLIVKGHHECVRECFYLSLCKSTDYYKRENTCKLNDADSISVETTEFEDKPGAVFSDITEWPRGMAGVCGQRPCSEKQKCFPDIHGYHCREVCGMVPTIQNGTVALNKAAGMLYMDTATVTCHEGYETGKPSIKCQASGTWESVSCEKMITDCKDMHQYLPSQPSGVYEIKLWQSLDWLSVYCDMDTDGGGWTVFQSRFNGSVDFYRNSSEYENGFGNIDTEFWLGLKYVQEMASQGQTELRLNLMAADGSSGFETFQKFYLDAGPEYTIHIDPGTGTIGDDVLLYALSYHNGQHFTTYDVDRDPHPENCAVLQHGGWWYNQCGGTNLNGEYVTPGTVHPSGYWVGMFYQQFKGVQSLKTSKVMFRRV